MKQTSLTVALFLMAATRWAKRHVDIDLYKMEVWTCLLCAIFFAHEQEEAGIPW